MTLTLVPVVEARWHGQPFEWAPASPTKGWLELSPNSSDDDVALVVATLAAYNRVASSGSISEVVRALETARSLVLPGGLSARTATLRIAPSCCCGLEGWREWDDVVPGGSSPWLGHGPSPWVDCKQDAAVLWADGDLGDQSPSVAVPYSEFEAARLEAHDAMIGFVSRLSEWLRARVPEGSNLSSRFAVAFDIA